MRDRLSQPVSLRFPLTGRHLGEARDHPLLFALRIARPDSRSFQGEQKKKKKSETPAGVTRRNRGAD